VTLRCTARAARLLAAAALLAAPLAAQVGRDPARSPYRDILYGNGWTVMAGRVYGDGGPLRLSPNSGTSFSVRYDVRFSGLLQGFVGLSFLGTERQVLAPDDSVAHRFSGPFDATVWVPEAGLQFNLTGPKTWHRLAPYVAASFGAAVGESTPQDTSEFTFGTKLMVSPSAGVRAYLSERVHLRVDYRLYYWKMKYPNTWLDEPAAQPGDVGNGERNAPVQSVDALDDWVFTPSLRVGLGIAF
jgi:hypothetical protein